ncbi:RimK-like ATP-grasp domain protein [uncultured Desulfobacterium sp.]|uniref:RimK-like ATP-grasp domain protein n=1 Tax=uncultured Desulfobacterium sp. TaxID=201089 RepID=A0A445MXP8_9BACT|nr:RimK-like ATP-grasp domain protein [uncultured Desulfobacterium sp.]
MILSFHPCLEADANIILGSRRLNNNDLDLIRNADAIILPQARPEEIYKACSGCGALMFPNYEARFKYPGKIGQARLFKEHGLPHPETICWRSVEQYEQSFPAGSESLPHSLPFLIKDDKTHEAEGVFLVEDRSGLESSLGFLRQWESSGRSGFITQAFVPSEGNVLRVVIVGKRIISYWKRPSDSVGLITTISRGAKVDHHWRPDLKEKGHIAVSRLALMSGINLAAADLVFSMLEKEPEPFFLEINYYFGREGLGGSQSYYQMLYQAVRNWLKDGGYDPDAVKLV